MKKRLRKVLGRTRPYGIDLVLLWRSAKGLSWYFGSLRQFKTQAARSDGQFPFGKMTPFLTERTAAAGTASGHYFHQDLLVARRVFANNPRRHVDVGSRVDGFAAHVASYRTLTVIDVRSLPNTIPNIEFVQADLMDALDPSLHHCTDSLSSLHAIEHFGLGRYGDPIEYDGYAMALNNLHKMLEPGGKLYVSTPIGTQRVEFNGQRVFSIRFLHDLLKNRYRFDQFSFVDDRGALHENVSLSEQMIDTNAGCHYGCGIWELTKA